MVRLHKGGSLHQDLLTLTYVIRISHEFPFNIYFLNLSTLCTCPLAKREAFIRYLAHVYSGTSILQREDLWQTSYEDPRSDHSREASPHSVNRP